MNVVALMGRITKDLELRSTGSTVVLDMTIAIDSGYGANKKANFFNCVAFGKTAEFISNYFAKGSLIAIQGSLNDASYTRADGTKVFKTNVIVKEVNFTGEKPKSNTNAAKGIESTPQQNGTVSIGDISEFEEILSDDETPF